ncbi:MAG: PLP-dependent transferase [Desulfobacteraceae bacterium]|nr:PLP-dependent transferase [Desulfobacteraceae bacterium]
MVFIITNLQRNSLQIGSDECRFFNWLIKRPATKGLIRLFVGIETAEDLIGDLQQTLE